MNSPDCLLACGCWQRFRIDLAHVGIGTCCVWHGDTYVTQVNTHEWHVRCQELGCSYGRWCGQSEGEARRLNGRHATSRNHRGGVAWDRITWDGKGSVYRHDTLRGPVRKPKPPPKPDRDRFVILDDLPPPF